MRKLVLVVTMGIAIQGGFLAGGCADAPPKPVTGEDPIVSGTLRMQLQTTSDSGKVYRLRNAMLPVDAPTGVTLNSETDPTKSVLEAFLNPGFHQIQLQDGWFIEQVDDLLGSSAFVDATLLSSSFQFFEIRSNEETFVKFDFEVDGQRVSFGPPGRLIVGIDVHERNGSAVCGNGVREQDESCDGGDFGFETCASVTLGALPNGFLLCSPFCSFDITFCSSGGVDGGVGGFGGQFDGGAAGFGGFGGSFEGGVGGFGGGSGGKAVGGAGGIVEPGDASTAAGGTAGGGGVVGGGGIVTAGAAGSAGKGRGKP
jgi:hypothetical protein